MDEKKKKFIQREIAVSRLLNHSNIVKMHDVIYEDFDKKVYMVFDLVSGGALLDFIISHDFLTEKAARPYFRQILSAVGTDNLVILSPFPPQAHVVLVFFYFLFTCSLLPQKLHLSPGPEN